MNRFSDQSVDRRRRVLVIDDDEATRRSFCDVLSSAGYETAEAWGAAHAMRLLLSYRPDVVVLDLMLPDGHGIEISRAMRAIVTTAHTCVVAVTSDSGSASLLDPATFGAEAILLKPVPADVLIDAVARCFGDAPLAPMVGNVRTTT